MSTTHELKTDPEVFQAVFDGFKKFEIRRDDRNFKVGDVLFLRETKHTGEDMKNGAPLEYTGREAERHVNYILQGPIYGLEAGWSLLSF